VAKRPVNKFSGCGFAVTRQRCSLFCDRSSDEQVGNDNMELVCVCFVHGELVGLAIITSHSLMPASCSHAWAPASGGQIGGLGRSPRNRLWK